MIACCVRQTNIVWIAMFFLLPFFEGHRHEPENTISLISIRQHVATYWPYPLILSLFMAFVYLNNGISVGMQEYMHIKIQLNNVFFFLIVFFAIYLPNIINELIDTPSGLKNRNVLLIIGISFIIYCFSFNELHSWNIRNIFYLLRNLPLQLITHSIMFKMAMFIPIALSIFSLTLNASKCSKLYVLLSVSFFYLLTMFLVEPRYYICIVAFYALFRSYKERKHELIQTVYLFAISWALFFYNLSFESVLQQF